MNKQEPIKFKVLSNELIERVAKKIWETEREPHYPYRHGWSVADPMVANICREEAGNMLSYTVPDTLRQLVEMLEGIENPFPLTYRVINDEGEYLHTENAGTHIGFDGAIQTIKQAIQHAIEEASNDTD